MNVLPNATLICSLLAAMFAGGCNGDVEIRHDRRDRRDRRVARVRTVRVTFVNATPARTAVRISVAGERRRNLGFVRPDGGELREDIVIGPRELPAEVTWTAGRFGGSFLITARSPDRERIVIGRPRPVVGGRRPVRAKRVSLLFVNNFNRVRKVWISVGGEEKELLGNIPADGELRHDLLIPRRALPARIDWNSSAVRGSFVVTRDSPDRERIEMGRPPVVVPPPPARAKTVRLLVVNNLNRRRAIWVSIAGGPKELVGHVDPNGQLRHDLLVPLRLLPAEVTWNSSGIKGSFIVTRRTDRARIVIDK